MRQHPSILTPLLFALLIGLCLPLAAQDTVDICIANGVVARIRDAGPYPSVRDRAAAIDKVIVDVISKRDTEHPQITLREDNGVWTIYAWDAKLMGVHQGEATANGLTPKQLGQVWAKNIRERFPLATPVSKMADPFGGKTGPPIPPVPPRPKPVVTEEGGTVVAQLPDAGSNPTSGALATPGGSSMSQSAALLVIIDAMRVSRGLTEDQWIDQREQLARNLLDSVSRFLAGKPMPTVVEPITPVTTTPPTVTTPPVTPTPPVTTPPVTTPTTGAPTSTTPPVTPPAAATTPPTTTTPVTAGATTPAGDPSYAKVPQKNRIRRKFAAAEQPFYNLNMTNPEGAKAVHELLKASRQAMTAEKFDIAEGYVDQALRAMGVDPTTIK